MYRNLHQAFVRTGKSAVPLGRLALDFITWNRLRRGETTPLEDHLPWMTISSIRFLNKILKPGMNVFEWGMGGSTLFFLDRGANVISVEHDPDWYQKTIDKVGSRLQWSPRLVIPEIGGEPQNVEKWSTYETSDESLRTFRFKAYATEIDAYPNEYFDLVLVDGRARPSCLHHALTKVAKNGYLLLDNAERETYQEEADAVLGSGFCRLDFSGATAYVDFFTCTTIWQKLNSQSHF